MLSNSTLWQKAFDDVALEDRQLLPHDEDFHPQDLIRICNNRVEESKRGRLTIKLPNGTHS